MQFSIAIFSEGETSPDSVSIYDNMAAAGDYLRRYIGDEYAENPNCSTENEVWLTYSHAGSGLARGGDFEFAFQGETIKVEVVYDGLRELLYDGYAPAEKAFARLDPEGPSDNDVMQVVEEVGASLINLGYSVLAKWRMRVNPDADAPSPEYEPSSGTEILPMFESDGRAQWPCAMGVVTVWDVK